MKKKAFYCVLNSVLGFVLVVTIAVDQTEKETRLEKKSVLTLF